MLIISCWVRLSFYIRTHIILLQLLMFISFSPVWVICGWSVSANDTPEHYNWAECFSKLCCLKWINNPWNFFYCLQSFEMFSTVSMASQSEIARRLEESSPENHQSDTGSPRFLSRSEISHGEHPLSLGKTSIWNQFFQVELYSIFVRCHFTLMMLPMHILMLDYGNS